MISSYAQLTTSQNDVPSRLPQQKSGEGIGWNVGRLKSLDGVLSWLFTVVVVEVLISVLVVEVLIAVLVVEVLISVLVVEIFQTTYSCSIRGYITYSTLQLFL